MNNYIPITFAVELILYNECTRKRYEISAFEGPKHDILDKVRMIRTPTPPPFYDKVLKKLRISFNFFLFLLYLSYYFQHDL